MKRGGMSRTRKKNEIISTCPCANRLRFTRVKIELELRKNSHRVKTLQPIQSIEIFGAYNDLLVNFDASIVSDF